MSADCPFVVVTSPRDANYINVGRPYFLNPINGKQNGTICPANSTTTLSFRAPDDHIFIDHVRITLWSLNAGQTIATWVDPDATAGVSSNVSLRIRDNSYQRGLNDIALRWNLLAGDAANPAEWPGTKYLLPSGMLDVEVINAELTTAFLISVTLVCRRVAAGPYANQQRQALNPAVFVDEEIRTSKPLRQDEKYNLTHKGVPQYLADAVNTLPSAFAAGSFVAPVPALPRQFVVVNSAQYNFLVKSFAGSMEVNTAGVVLQPMQDPVFVSVRARNYDEWLTDQFIPYQHLFGDGTNPGYLPIEWLLKPNDAIIIQVQSFSNRALNLNFGVWGTYRTDADGAVGAYA